MATCKDCIHYDICTFNLTGKENEKCLQFLNKADVVEVVRCKDCIHWVSLKKYDLHFCFKKGGLLGITAEKDFCSYGERMEKEE